MITPAESRHEELLRIVRDVRRRWRWKVAVRSLAVVVGAGLLTFLAAAYGLERFRFSPPAIVTFRIATYLVLVVLGWRFLVRPLVRRVTDQQVALYLEEHEPGLDALLLSAVDVGAPGRSLERSGESTALLRRLVESAIERCREVEFGRWLERRSLRRSAAVMAAIGLAAAVIYVAGPAYLRHGALALLLPVRSVEAASPYRIEVKPGDATVARGADVAIAARLFGFTAPEVDLFTRTSAGAPFEGAPMVAGPEGDAFDAMLFSLREPLEYFVQSAGVRSPVFTIDVADLPYVERLELEYVFPAYTGLAPQKIEQGGDIAAPRGTTVRARVHSTLRTQGGRIVRDDRDTTALAVEPDGTLTGGFEVAGDGFYRIELQSPAGSLVSASPQYTIDVLADQPPTVSFSKPGRDLKPSRIEEVFVEAKADDDFGVARLDLVFSVNGGPERTRRLVSAGARPLKAVTAGHTFFLEEMSLQPGDVVSYFARAADNDAVQGAKSVTSDIYFLQIRPFRKDLRAAESQAGMPGAGGMNEPGALSEQQRRIVTATFNVVRDRDKLTADKFREDVVFLTLAQGQLRERVETLTSQINARVAPADETMRQIAGWLGEAAKAMRAAEGKLQARAPKDALPPEQQALANLQRAEEAYREVRVRLSEQQGGGGGGQQADSMAEELADLFQLEMDKLRNQYETFQRGEQQAADNKVDELLERLRELARRQEQEAERQRRLAGNRQTAGSAGGGGARQRQLAGETEEAARQLERLSREAERPDLAEAARRMREAADAMRRAAARGDASAFAEASAAAERLKQVRERLEQQRSDRMARDIQDALERVRQLAEDQQEIESGVRGLGQAGANRRRQVERLMERKDAQAGEVASVEQQLDRTASDFRRERPQAARKVQEAADAIRDDKLKEKIRYSKGLVQGAPPEAAASFEEQIGSDIASLEQRLRDAAAAAGETERDAQAEALDRARDLVRGLESLDQRLRDRGRGGSSDRQQQQGRGGSSDPPTQGQQGGRGGSSDPQQQQGRGGSSDPPAQGQQGGRGGSLDPRSTAREGSQFGVPQTPGGWASSRPGEFGEWDWRQFQREARERRGEAQELRRALQALGVDVTDLDRLIRDLRALDRERIYTDLDEIARLQSQLIEGSRRFEFALRRQLGALGADRLTLSGSDEAPAAYRKLIEEYYRQLAKQIKR